MSDVYVVGIDMIKFGRFPDRTVPQIGAEAALLAEVVGRGVGRVADETDRADLALGPAGADSRRDVPFAVETVRPTRFNTTLCRIPN